MGMTKRIGFKNNHVLYTATNLFNLFHQETLKILNALVTQ